MWNKEPGIAKRDNYAGRKENTIFGWYILATDTGRAVPTKKVGVGVMRIGDHRSRTSFPILKTYISQILFR